MVPQVWVPINTLVDLIKLAGKSPSFSIRAQIPYSQAQACLTTVSTDAYSATAAAWRGRRAP